MLAWFANLPPLAQLQQIQLDAPTNILLGVVLALLGIAWFIGRILKRQPESAISPAVVRTFNLRIGSWWMIYVILIAGFKLGYLATVVFFFLVSFWALREFITMTPTRRGDHRALFWTFIAFTPLHYYFVWLGRDYYGVYTVMIPVYASLVIPARVAFSGDPKRFLERTAKIQAALLICVYALSHAPALLDLRLQDSTGRPWGRPTVQREADRLIFAQAQPSEPTGPPAKDSPKPAEPPKPAEQPKAPKLAPRPTPEVGPPGPPVVSAAGAELVRTGSNAGLLFYFILLVQLNDVFQYAWGIMLGKHVIAPQINASRTWEGFIGGCLSTMLLATLLVWVTPFQTWQGALMGLVISVAGFAGGMTMSAIKRERGVKDYGTLVQGHAGVLDRIDSLCFAAPVFFHLTRYFFTSIGG